MQPTQGSQVTQRTVYACSKAGLHLMQSSLHGFTSIGLDERLNGAGITNIFHRLANLANMLTQLSLDHEFVVAWGAANDSWVKLVVC